MKTIHKFEISAEFYLELVLPYEEADLLWTDIIEINLYYNYQIFSLSTGFAFDAIGEAFLTLEQLLNGKLRIKDSLQIDLGYLRNEYFNQTAEIRKRDQRFVFEQCEKTNGICWIGLKYFIWASSINSTDTCVYEKNNAYYFEIVPLYPWFFKEPDQNFTSYEEFIKNYQSILTIEIPRATIVALYETMVKINAILETK